MSHKVLTADQLASYRSQGFVAPVRALDPAHASRLGALLERTDRAVLRQKKLHLLFKWMNDLVRTPRILDAVQDVLGPNLLVWNTALFLKRARDPAFVSWHQDATYWGLQPPDVVTAWVALSPSNRFNGALRVIPGSHLAEQLPHRDTFAKDNLLQRGQEIAVEVDEAQAAMCELEPGEMSLHHILLVHGSDPNPADYSRIGFAVRYIAPHVRQATGHRDTATLVRGVDEHGHFDLEDAPEADMSPAAVAYHRKIVEAANEITLR